jgi:hypothetical protein
VSRRALALSLAALLALAAALATAHAETLYVVEQVVVNVNSAPDASGERIATVKSGEGVELLERQGEQVHVRLAGGRDGWIRAGYLSAAAPLRTQLAQRDAEVARLQDEVNRLTAQPAALPPGPPPPRPCRLRRLRLRGLPLGSRLRIRETPPGCCSPAAPPNTRCARGRGRSVAHCSGSPSVSGSASCCSTATSAASTGDCAFTEST